MSDEPCRSCRGRGVVGVNGDPSGWFADAETCGRCEGTKIEPRYQIYADGTTYKVLSGVTAREWGPNEDDEEPF